MTTRSFPYKRIKSVILTIWLCFVGMILFFPVVVSVFDGVLSHGMSGFADFLLWEPEWLRAFWTSMFLAAGTAIGSVIIAVPAAYVFAKFRFRGRDILFFLYVMVMLMPFQVTMLPQYMTAKTIGTYDTIGAVLLPGIFAPLAVFLLTQLARGIPDAVLEAARLETGNELTILRYIVLPQMKSGVVCVMVLQFTEYWSMVTEPLVLMETAEKFPLALLIAQSVETIPAVAAATVIILIPTWLLYGVFQEEIRQGLKDYHI